MNKPLIGITAYSYHRPDSGWLYDVCYRGNARAIERAGGLPVLIPTGLPEADLRGIYDRVDAVLLPGGGDVNPQRYHAATQHPTVGGIDDSRDTTEMLMTRWAVDEDRPVLGICRGIQVMNVALGGTLIQDIPSTVAAPLVHDIARDKPRSTRMHDVTIEPGTRLAQIVGTAALPVNSLHHQAIATPAAPVKITACAPDGVPEALEVPERSFVLAVQWHPEDMIDDEPRMQRLFEAFVSAARDRMRR
ncbi:MAG: gamma-glutamyl-gamma-aminobutyrate hydrolase family protein [Anaerolineae bacterium]|nr:gamma-glutamyl-gamma-aminobutyrate hydrolase family protein [Anaerolineae bacterium]